MRTPEAFDIEKFKIDWEAEKVICPEGKESINWKETVASNDRPLVRAFYSMKDCKPCPSKHLCTKGKRRTLGFWPQAQYEALKEARTRHASAEGKLEYNRRAGVEGTISQGVRAFGLRKARYRGLAKTHLQNVATAAALNIERLVAWLEDVPTGKDKGISFCCPGSRLTLTSPTVSEGLFDHSLTFFLPKRIIQYGYAKTARHKCGNELSRGFRGC